MNYIDNSYINVNVVCDARAREGLSHAKKKAVKESEKTVEGRLRKEIAGKGGIALKLLPDINVGLPDRLVLLPGGRVVFVETKTTGEKPRRLQTYIHTRLRDLGFDVRVIDTVEKVTEFVEGL